VMVDLRGAIVRERPPDAVGRRYRGPAAPSRGGPGRGPRVNAGGFRFKIIAPATED
jgi:hypothetical protein